VCVVCLLYALPLRVGGKNITHKPCAELSCNLILLNVILNVGLITCPAPKNCLSRGCVSVGPSVKKHTRRGYIDGVRLRYRLGVLVQRRIWGCQRRLSPLAAARRCCVNCTSSPPHVSHRYEALERLRFCAPAGHWTPPRRRRPEVAPGATSNTLARVSNCPTVSFWHELVQLSCCNRLLFPFVYWTYVRLVSE
jgi:hypothetical protein